MAAGKTKIIFFLRRTKFDLVIRVNLVASLFLVGRAHWFAWIRQKKKKKNGRRSTLSAIALSRPSPGPELVPCNMCSCCECCAGLFPTRLRFLTLICSLVESDQLGFQRRRWTKLRGIAQCPWLPMAGELVSFRHIVDGRTCLDWYVLNVGDERSFFSIAEELCKTSAEEKRLPQFRFAIPRKSGQEEDQAEWSLRCFVGKDRGEATVEVGGSLNCCSTAQQFGRFVTLELKTGEHRQRPTAGSAFGVLMSSPARGGSSVGQLPPKKGANIADGQLRGDWRLFNALVDVMERRVILFSCNLAFPNCCYSCGSTEDLVDEEELRGRYQRVHQVCGACKERGRVARTRGPVRGVAPAAKRRKKWSPAAQGRTSALFAVSCTCVEFEQVKFVFCESCRDWASSRLFIALRSCLESGSAVFTRQSTELSTIQSFMQLYGCTVWWLSFVWTLFTLSLCVKRG